MKTTFIYRLEIALEKRGISTLNDLAKKCKISIGTIQGWKRVGSLPQPAVLERLTSALGVQSDWLLGSNDAEPDWDVPPGSSIPSPASAARYNAEMAIRAAGKLPESARALNWLCSALLMVGSGLENGGSPAMEKEAVRVLGLLFRHAMGDEEPAKKG